MDLFDFKSFCVNYKQIFIFYWVFISVLSGCTSGSKGVVKSPVDSISNKNNGKKIMLSCGCIVGNTKFDKDSLFTKVEINPEPPGGMKIFREWILKNYIIPKNAFENKVKGIVMISFIVQKSGDLTDFVIEFDKGYDTETASIEMLQKSHKWKPGISFGIPVRTKYALPIRLDLEKMQIAEK